MGVKVKRWKGAWYLFVNYHGKRKAKRFTSRTAALRVAQQLQEKLAHGDVTFLKAEEKLPSFSEYSDSWLKAQTAGLGRNIKPSTIHFYREFLTLYVLPRFGTCRLDSIERDHVKGWLSELTARGLSKNTIRLACSTLRVILTDAVEDAKLSSNPARELGRFMESENPEREGQALTEEDAARFLEGAREFCPHRYPPFLTALRAGLREGEIAALRFGDIQFGESANDPNRYILVQRTYDLRTGKFLTPKSKRRRRVDLSKGLRQALLELRDERLFTAFASGKEEVSEELVFPSEVALPSRWTT